MLDRISVHGARQHNLKNIDVEIPRNSLTVITGLERIGEILVGFRYYLRGGTAALRGDALHLCAPVPGPDGAAGCGFDRRPESGDFDRAEDHQPQPALHGRHHHRDLRLPAAAVLLDRRTALPGLRQRDFAADHGADSAARAGAEAGRPVDGDGADRARAQGRVQERSGEAGAAGFCARAHRWRAAVAGRRVRAGQAARITPSKWWWTGCW